MSKYRGIFSALALLAVLGFDHAAGTYRIFLLVLGVSSLASLAWIVYQDFTRKGIPEQSASQDSSKTQADATPTVVPSSDENSLGVVYLPETAIHWGGRSGLKEADLVAWVDTAVSLGEAMRIKLRAMSDERCEVEDTLNPASRIEAGVWSPRREEEAQKFDDLALRQQKNPSHWVH